MAEENDACAVAHGAAPAPVPAASAVPAPAGTDRTLVAVFASPVSGYLLRYAADAGKSPERRREADGTIQSFHLRDNDLAAYANATEPMLQPIGMLMLVPSSRA